MSSAAEITAKDFDSQVLQSTTPVLVDFWAPWCGPCRMVGPIVEEIAQEKAGQIKVFKLNVDNESTIAARYGIMSIPTLMLFKGGDVVQQIVGVMPKQDILGKLTPFLT